MERALASPGPQLQKQLACQSQLGPSGRDCQLMPKIEHLQKTEVALTTQIVLIYKIQFSCELTTATFHGLYLFGKMWISVLVKNTHDIQQGVSQEGKKPCVLHELGNKMQLGVWGNYEPLRGFNTVKSRWQSPWKTNYIQL